MRALITAGLVVIVVSTLTGTATYAYVRRVRAVIEGVVQRFLAGPLVTGVIALVVVAAIGVGSAAGFVELSEKLERGSPKVSAVDDAVHRWFVISSDGGTRRFFAQLGHGTGPAVLPWAVGLVVVVLLVLRRWAEALYVAIVTGGCAAMIYAMKLYFARARPEVAAEVLRETTYSFPSGHSAMAVAVFGSVAYLLVRTERNPRRIAFVASLATAAVTLTAIARVFLGVHWLSDIGAGLLAGLSWLVVASASFALFIRRRRLT